MGAAHSEWRAYCCASRGPGAKATPPGNGDYCAKERPEVMLARIRAVSLGSAPLVVCGPTGVGKGEIIRELVRRYPDSLGFCVSHTTRAPKAVEKDGVDYHFTFREMMQAEIAAGKFVEWIEVRGVMYGTSRMALQQVADSGKAAVLDIDVSGVRQLKKASLVPEPHYVFVMPPGDATVDARLRSLKERLQGRGVHGQTKLRHLMDDARDAFAYASENEGANFDFVVVNDRIADAVDALAERVRQTWMGSLKSQDELYV